MATTTYVSSTFSAHAIGARTDAAGVAVTDLSAEEARLPLALLTAGRVTPSNAFVVAPQSPTPNMTVKVGSGAAKADHYIVGGANAGQGRYLVRLDVTSQNVTIDPADASQARTDEIYLVVRDNVYDASARALPQLAYRKGDLGGAVPGPDPTWRASELLATVPVAAAAATIAGVTDARVQATLLSALIPAVDVNAIGYTQGRYIIVEDGATNVVEPVGWPTGAIGERGEFSFTGVAGAFYAVECYIPTYVPSLDDIQFSWTYPVGTTMRWSSWGLDAADTDQIGSIDTGSLSEAQSVIAPGNNMVIDPTLRPVASVAIGSTGGKVTLNFRAVVAGPVYVRVGAWMKITRLA